MASDFLLKRAAGIINSGGVVAYPTEGVYGLGCLPDEGEAVMRILQLKGRRIDKGLILIASSLEQLDDYIEPLSRGMRSRVTSTWPGPHTWIVPAKPDAPPWLTGGRDTLAVRVTAETIARRLCDLTASPLVSTSANREGRSPARTQLASKYLFGIKVDFYVPGRVGGLGSPTPIRDARDGQIVRQ